tara:strand:+ start:189 stop:317 length:129 start_codon:yes stop_codon:yes gene_type:complete
MDRSRLLSWFKTILFAAGTGHLKPLYARVIGGAHGDLRKCAA